MYLLMSGLLVAVEHLPPAQSAELDMLVLVLALLFVALAPPLLCLVYIIWWRVRAWRWGRYVGKHMTWALSAVGLEYARFNMFRRPEGAGRAAGGWLFKGPGLGLWIAADTGARCVYTRGAPARLKSASNTAWARALLARGGPELARLLEAGGTGRWANVRVEAEWIELRILFADLLSLGPQDIRALMGALEALAAHAEAMGPPARRVRVKRLQRMALYQPARLNGLLFVFVVLPMLGMSGAMIAFMVMITFLMIAALTVITAVAVVAVLVAAAAGAM